MSLFLCQVIEARCHIDRLDFRILAIFRRANLYAQVTAGAIFRGDLQYIFLTAHITGFYIQRLQRGRGVLHGFWRNHLGTNG